MVQGMTSFLRGVVINLEKKYAEEYGEIKREF